MVLDSQRTLTSYQAFYNVIKETGGNAVTLEIFAIMLSILHISAGGWLLRSQKIGILLGLGLAGVDMMIYGLVLFAQSLVLFLTPLLVAGSLLTVTILLGWEEFKNLPLFETQDAQTSTASQEIRLHRLHSKDAKQVPELLVHEPENEDQSTDT